MHALLFLTIFFPTVKLAEAGIFGGLFCKPRCNPNPGTLLSSCAFKCGWFRFGRYYDGSTCWVLAGIGRAFKARGYCKSGICMRHFGASYEGSEAEKFCRERRPEPLVIPSSGNKQDSSTTYIKAPTQGGTTAAQPYNRRESFTPGAPTSPAQNKTTESLLIQSIKSTTSSFLLTRPPSGGGGETGRTEISTPKSITKNAASTAGSELLLSTSAATLNPPPYKANQNTNESEVATKQVEVGKNTSTTKATAERQTLRINEASETTSPASSLGALGTESAKTETVTSSPEVASMTPPVTITNATSETTSTASSPEVVESWSQPGMTSSLPQVVSEGVTASAALLPELTSLTTVSETIPPLSTASPNGVAEGVNETASEGAVRNESTGGEIVTSSPKETSKQEPENITNETTRTPSPAFAAEVNESWSQPVMTSTVPQATSEAATTSGALPPELISPMNGSETMPSSSTPSANIIAEEVNETATEGAPQTGAAKAETVTSSTEVARTTEPVTITNATSETTSTASSPEIVESWSQPGTTSSLPQPVSETTTPIATLSPELLEFSTTGREAIPPLSTVSSNISEGVNGTLSEEAVRSESPRGEIVTRSPKETSKQEPENITNETTRTPSPAFAAEVNESWSQPVMTSTVPQATSEAATTSGALPPELISPMNGSETMPSSSTPSANIIAEEVNETATEGAPQTGAAKAETVTSSTEVARTTEPVTITNATSETTSTASSPEIVESWSQPGTTSSLPQPVSETTTPIVTLSPELLEFSTTGREAIPPLSTVSPNISEGVNGTLSEEAVRSESPRGEIVTRSPKETSKQEPENITNETTRTPSPAFAAEVNESWSQPVMTSTVPQATSEAATTSGALPPELISPMNGSETMPSSSTPSANIIAEEVNETATEGAPQTGAAKAETVTSSTEVARTTEPVTITKATSETTSTASSPEIVESWSQPGTTSSLPQPVSETTTPIATLSPELLEFSTTGREAIPPLSTVSPNISEGVNGTLSEEAVRSESPRGEIVTRSPKETITQEPLTITNATSETPLLASRPEVVESWSQPATTTSLPQAVSEAATPSAMSSSQLTSSTSGSEIIPSLSTASTKIISEGVNEIATAGVVPTESAVKEIVTTTAKATRTQPPENSTTETTQTMSPASTLEVVESWNQPATTSNLPHAGSEAATPSGTSQLELTWPTTRSRTIPPSSSASAYIIAQGVKETATEGAVPTEAANAETTSRSPERTRIHQEVTITNSTSEGTPPYPSPEVVESWNQPTMASSIPQPVSEAATPSITLSPELPFSTTVSKAIPPLSKGSPNIVAQGVNETATEGALPAESATREIATTTPESTKTLQQENITNETTKATSLASIPEDIVWGSQPVTASSVPQAASEAATPNGALPPELMSPTTGSETIYPSTTDSTNIVAQGVNETATEGVVNTESAKAETVTSSPEVARTTQPVMITNPTSEMASTTSRPEVVEYWSKPGTTSNVPQAANEAATTSGVLPLELISPTTGSETLPPSSIPKVNIIAEGVNETATEGAVATLSAKEEFVTSRPEVVSTTQLVTIANVTSETSSAASSPKVLESWSQAGMTSGLPQAVSEAAPPSATVLPELTYSTTARETIPTLSTATPNVVAEGVNKTSMEEFVPTESNRREIGTPRPKATRTQQTENITNVTTSATSPTSIPEVTESWSQRVKTSNAPQSAAEAATTSGALLPEMISPMTGSETIPPPSTASANIINQGVNETASEEVVATESAKAETVTTVTSSPEVAGTTQLVTITNATGGTISTASSPKVVESWSQPGTTPSSPQAVSETSTPSSTLLPFATTVSEPIPPLSKASPNVVAEGVNETSTEGAVTSESTRREIFSTREEATTTQQTKNIRNETTRATSPAFIPEFIESWSRPATTSAVTEAASEAVTTSGALSPELVLPTTRNETIPPSSTTSANVIVQRVNETATEGAVGTEPVKAESVTRSPEVTSTPQLAMSTNVTSETRSSDSIPEFVESWSQAGATSILPQAVSEAATPSTNLLAELTSSITVSERIPLLSTASSNIVPEGVNETATEGAVGTVLAKGEAVTSSPEVRSTPQQVRIRNATSETTSPPSSPEGIESWTLPGTTPSLPQGVIEAATPSATLSPELTPSTTGSETIPPLSTANANIIPEGCNETATEAAGASQSAKPETVTSNPEVTSTAQAVTITNVTNETTTSAFSPEVIEPWSPAGMTPSSPQAVSEAATPSATVLRERTSSSTVSETVPPLSTAGPNVLAEVVNENGTEGAVSTESTRREIVSSRPEATGMQQLENITNATTETTYPAIIPEVIESWSQPATTPSLPQAVSQASTPSATLPPELKSTNPEPTTLTGSVSSTMKRAITGSYEDSGQAPYRNLESGADQPNADVSSPTESTNYESELPKADDLPPETSFAEFLSSLLKNADVEPHSTDTANINDHDRTTSPETPAPHHTESANVPIVTTAKTRRRNGRERRRRRARPVQRNRLQRRPTTQSPEEKDYDDSNEVFRNFESFYRYIHGPFFPYHYGFLRRQ
ncbi:uncharacterized protein LOC144146831 [Haemaphysalis longicornis]